VSLQTCFQESKRAFLRLADNEEGSKGKLEAFINFCEDAIFEVSGIHQNVCGGFFPSTVSSEGFV